MTLKSGAQLWDGVRLGDDVFVGPNATFSNDRFPRFESFPEKFDTTVVERGASIGANATILPNITIGQNAMIGAGAVVTQDVPPNAIVVGNPGDVGYTSTDGSQTNSMIDPDLHQSEAANPRDLGVGGTQLWSLQSFKDMRGEIVPVEFTGHLPFTPKRHFVVFGVPDGRVRGAHAHRECHQLLIALTGEFHMVLNDCVTSVEVILKRPTFARFTCRR